ncbi:hypothetical protein AADZ90_013885 [Aestuariibius sp. 2305UL40-4]|uniref:NmrA family NAD(P)-binding protein n=1 Tax=Aestuariibius violaceus TaxID=3234132 RepID=UPI00345E134C
MPRTVTLPAATGTQQSAIAAAFEAAGWTTRRLSRATHPDQSAEGLAKAMEGSDLVVATLPQDHRPGAMTDFAEAMAAAVRMAGIPAYILNLAGRIPPNGTGPLFDDMRQARASVSESGARTLTVEPTVYLDNLMMPVLRDGIANGTLAYPAPAEAPIAWLSHRDLAAYIVAATENGLTGQLRIGGAEPLPGPALAQAIGKGVTYQQLPIEVFASAMNDALGAPAGDRIATLYKALAENPDFMATKDPEAQALNIPLETASDFAARALT